MLIATWCPAPILRPGPRLSAKWFGSWAAEEAVNGRYWDPSNQKGSAPRSRKAMGFKLASLFQIMGTALSRMVALDNAIPSPCATGIHALFLVDLTLALLASTCDGLRVRFPYVEVGILKASAADEVEVEAAIRNTIRQSGRIVIGINCAGISDTPTPAREMSRLEGRELIDVKKALTLL
ncbi:hypothetical protein N7492_003139 [Penicillium capsulatum]|uniref:Uncharacterized protein n=1 Tax=Penicillium capsulatum TaxID=69766 RepID=A0A9W9ILC6_9EURO|nr:hypothetical protein N7492_003139 [Penicillium capsulatum]KAJ6122271.1 hypothetical protein N7512_004736 [Penicillium capsulatum]